MREVLYAAALTYVAAVVQTLSTLLYYVFLLGGSRRRAEAMPRKARMTPPSDRINLLDLSSEELPAGGGLGPATVSRRADLALGLSLAHCRPRRDGQPARSLRERLAEETVVGRLEAVDVL